MAYLLLKEEKEFVRSRLKKAKYDDVSLTGWGRLDEFIYFLYSVGLFDILKKTKLERLRAGIPQYLVLSTFCMKILLGIPSIRQIKESLFKDRMVLKLLGYTTRHIEEGFSRRSKGKSLPINVDTLRNLLKRISPEQIEVLFDLHIKSLSSKNLLKGKLYALDATDISVDGDTYQNQGEVVKAEDIVDKKGRIRTRVTKSKGYKLILLQNIHKKRRIVVGLKVVPLNEHEINYCEPLIKKAQILLGKDAIDILVMDRGFLDGALLYTLKNNYHIDTIVPLKKNMEILKDMEGLSKIDTTKITRKGPLKIQAFDELTSLESYPGKISGFLVTKQNRKSQAKWGYLTTLPTGDALRLYQLYRRRWTIENEGIRELKQGYLLNKLPGRKFNTVVAHCAFTLLMYNLVTLYRTSKGYQLKEKGIRTLRTGTLEDIYGLFVEIQGRFGVFSIKEFMFELRGPPEDRYSKDTVKIYIPAKYPSLLKKFGLELDESALKGE